MKRPLLFFIALCLSWTGLVAQTTERVFLSGHDKDDAVPWRFQVTSGARAGEWTTLPVPSHWDMHGFGTLSYKRDLPTARDEKGLYELDFPAPAVWQGRRVFLVFEGAMTDTTATVNGESVGPTHQGGFFRFKYEITSALKLGASNKLQVTVARYSANASVNRAERDADYWVFGGIYRPVYLEIQPQQFVERVAINAGADGQFQIDVHLDGAPEAEVEVQLQTLQGRNVGGPFFGKAQAGKASLKANINSPQPWTAETPHLYQAQVRLKRNDQIVHEHSQRFGFRTFEVRDGDGFYLNGNRVVLKGVNRHSYWPESGRALSEAVHRLDITTIKDANMNAVRMSHYPPDQQFLDLCDELGLYVLNELPGWHQNYDNEVGPKLVREMVIRDVNHPCVVFWDNGDEGGHSLALVPVFAEYDPQRRRVLHPWTTFGGVNTAHYLSFDLAATAASGTRTDSQLKWAQTGYHRFALDDPKRYVYMPTEFQHGLFDGGAGAGLEEVWRVMSASRYNGGGFIWNLADEAIKRPDNGQLDTADNQAPDGIVGPYRQREGSFYTIKEVWSPIEVARDDDGSFLVRNHYGFTNAKDCTFAWQLRRFALPNAPTAQTGFSVLREGTVRGPDVAPGNTARWQIDLPKEQAEADAVALKVTDPSGRELWTWVWPLAQIERYAQTRDQDSSDSAQVTETADRIDVAAGELVVSFSKATGLLSHARRGAQTFSLTDGPVFTGEPGKLESISVQAEGKHQLVSAAFSGPLKTVTWRVRNNGWVDCDYRYLAEKEPKPYIGVTFNYPEKLVKGKRWLGDGPFRVWKNRLRGVALGVWANDYNDTITGYRDWVYPEFKGFFANVRWMQLVTEEGTITFLVRNVPYVQVLKAGSPPEKLVGEAKMHMPDRGIGFMHGITPLGAKFKKPEDMGTQSRLPQLQGEQLGSISIYFGQL